VDESAEEVWESGINTAMETERLSGTVFGQRIRLVERYVARRGGPLFAELHEESLDACNDRVAKKTCLLETDSVRIEEGKEKADRYRGALTTVQQIHDIESGDVDELPRCYDKVNQGFHLGVGPSLGSQDSRPVSLRLEIELPPRRG
jgi:hypothetical protein